MVIILPILFAGIFAYILYKHPFFSLQEVPMPTLHIFFALKIIAGTALWAIYTYYYTDRSNADIYKYFDDSKIMFDALLTNPVDYFKMLFGVGNDSPYFDSNYYTKMNHWYREFESNIYNDAHTIIRFNAFVRIFSFGNYHVHTVFMCFFSLVGLVALYKALAEFIQHKKLLAFAIFFVPSVLFWGSGVLKEGLVFFGLGMLIYHFFKFTKGEVTWYRVLLTFFSLWILLILKFYVLIALLPGMVAYAIVKKWQGRPLLIHVAILLLFVIIALNLHHIFPQYDLLYILSRKQLDYIGLVQEWSPHSAVAVTPLEPTITSFLSNLPEALNNTFLRPYIWNSNGALLLFSALENTLILLSILLAIVFIKPLKKIDFNLLGLIISYVLVLYILIGWITPVIGSIVRYKVPAIPLLLVGVLLVIDIERIKNKFPFLNKTTRKQ